jgi:potassium efflux system protein
VLVGALAAGYYYTVLQMSERLLMSLALVVIWVMLRATIERGLALAARRLAWERAERARASEDEDAESDSERHELDISVVNEQSLRLLRLLLILLLGAGLYWIWADLISLFAYLDNVALYEGAVDGGLDSPVASVSMRDFINALIIAGMTIMLARNLPGLMEVLFLSRFKLALALLCGHAAVVL